MRRKIMIAITNARIFTMKSGLIEKGDILIKDNKIIKISEQIELDSETEVYDAQGKTVMPGLIDAHTHLGVDEEGIGWEGEDFNEIDNPITPHLRVVDAVNPFDKGFISAHQNGITTVMTSPGSANILGGEAAAIKTAGRIIDKMLVQAPVGIKAAFGENPKKVYSNLKKSPMTRMGIAAMLRESLMEAEDYLAEKNENRDAFKRNLKNESLLKVLNKEIPLKAHVHRADDIMTAIRIAREFDLDLTLEHCTEGHLVAEEIAEAGFAAAVGPSLTGRVKVELNEMDFKTAGILAKAGVKVALVSDHPVTPVKNLLLYAALAVKSGLDQEEALKAVTINPAEMLKISDRVGSIEEGKDADLIVLDGEPLSFDTGIVRVMIDGSFVK
jgi:imidazolonepropionase-like amidohydrolase